MAQTFRDFVTECELYPFSDENYQIMKECSELRLMGQFIENQKVMVEQSEVLSNPNLVLTEGFLMESVDSQTIEMLEQQFTEKANNIFKKIWGKIKKFLKIFANFFRKAKDKITKHNDKSKKLLNDLNSCKMSEERFTELKDAIDGVRSREGCNFKAYKNQPFASKIKVKYEGSSQKDFNELVTYLAVALSTKTVIAEVPVISKDMGAISAKGILDVCKHLEKADNNLNAKIKAGASLYGTYWADARKNGVEIDADVKDVEKTIEKLDDLAEKLGQNGVIRKEEDGEAASGGDQGVDKLTQMIITAIGQTTKIYTSYINFRSAAVDAIEKWCKSSNGSKNTKAAKAAEEEPADTGSEPAASEPAASDSGSNNSAA